MMNYLNALYEGATETSVDEIIGALMIGLCLAFACAGLCLLAHKRTQSPFSLMSGLILAVAAISMALGVGHARHRYLGSAKLHGSNNPEERRGPGGPDFRGGPAGIHPFSRDLVREADSDGDGRLTPEEAAQFVRKADKAGKGWTDTNDIDHSVFGGGKPTPAPEPPPAPTSDATDGRRQPASP